MKVDIERNNGDLMVHLEGRLDSTTADQLDKTIEQEINDEVKSLTIDLSKIDYISSMGLRVLVRAHKALKGREITLSGANHLVIDVLRMSNLIELFKMV